MRASVLLVIAAASIAAQDPQPRIFRSGVDLVVVDAMVLDAEGRPITDLTADDFLVTAAGKPRKVRSAEFVPVVTASRAAASRLHEDAIAESTSNRGHSESKSFLIVIDVGHIDAGGGTRAIRSIADFVSRLAPDDRVGIVALPNGKPRLDLTRNHTLVTRTLGLIVGASQQRDEEMSVGEAVFIARGDRKTTDDWIHRTLCGPPRDPVCTKKARDMAEPIVREQRWHTQTLLDSLRRLALAMAPLPGLKTIVLVSQGMLRDSDATIDLRRFAEAAAAARVTLYSLVLDTPQTLASDSGTRPPDRRLDTGLETSGMADVANAAGGELFHISGAVDDVLRRIDAQLAGYYLLSFESDAGDVSGKRRTIQIRVRRPHASVRARSDFSIPTGASSAAIPAADLRARVGELIKWPVPVGEVPMDVATFAAAPASGTERRPLIIAVELPAGVRPAAAGYEIVNEAGKPVADAFEPNPVVQGLSDRTTYVAGIALDPGSYQLKLGMVLADGRRGSIEHAFQVPMPSGGPVRLGDLFIGIAGADTFQPIVRVPADAVQVAVEAELQADAAEWFDKARVLLDVTRRGETAALARAAMPLGQTRDPLKRVASARLTVGRLAPGEYMLRATLQCGTTTEQVSRVMRKE